MKLEQQVCSLELAKQLKDLGVKQKSQFYYGLKENTWILLFAVYNGFVSETGQWHARDEFKEWYSAFTVAELGRELMKHEIENFDQVPTWDTYHKKWYFQSGYKYESWETEWIKLGTNDEANARALMLIYLIENKLI